MIMGFNIENGVLKKYAGKWGVTEVVIPDSVTAIGDGAFFGCDSLTSIVIPDSVTAIGDGAFRWCSSVSSIVIPDSVATIGYHAFERCSRNLKIHVSSLEHYMRLQITDPHQLCLNMWKSFGRIKNLPI